MNSKTVHHTLHTREVNWLFLSLAKLFRKPGKKEKHYLTLLGSFTSTMNYSLYGAYNDIVQTVFGIKRFPVHRALKKITVAFPCPIGITEHRVWLKKERKLEVARPSWIRSMLGAKHSTIQLQTSGGNAIYTLVIGSKREGDFLDAMSIFLRDLYEMHNMIAVWKHVEKAKKNLENHEYQGCDRELKSITQSLTTWLEKERALS